MLIRHKDILNKIKCYFGEDVMVDVNGTPYPGYLIKTLDDYLRVGGADIIEDLESGLVKLKLRTYADLDESEMAILCHYENLFSFEDLKLHLDDIDFVYNARHQTIKFLQEWHVDYQNLIDVNLAVRVVSMFN